MIDHIPFLDADEPPVGGRRDGYLDVDVTVATISLPALRVLCWPVLAAGVAVCLWLTLKRSGEVPSLRPLPDAVTAWMNSHGRLRNVPAFFLLAAPAFLLAGRSRLLSTLGALAVVAAAVEFAQLAIRGRFFDPLDILLSWLGLVLCWTCFRGGHALLSAPLEPEEVQP